MEFPIEHAGSFHSYVNVYQRVSEIHGSIGQKVGNILGNIEIILENFITENLGMFMQIIYFTR